MALVLLIRNLNIDILKKPAQRELTDDEVRKEVIKGWIFAGILILFLFIVGCYSIEAIKTINHFR